MEKQEAKNKQSLVLALVGDSVESLWLRNYFANNCELNVNIITKKINKIVNAKAQAECLKKIEPMLTGDEADIVRRARNTHTHSTAKNYSVIEYRYATAFEALLGYLFLANDYARIDEFMNIIIGE